MKAKELAERLLEYPEDEISINRELTLSGNVATTLTIYRDILKKKVKFNYDWREVDGI